MEPLIIENISSLRPTRSAMKVHPLFLVLSVLATTARCVTARSWVDTIDPSVYAQAVIDPARATMSIEDDPFEPHDGDKEIPGVTASPTLLPTSFPVANIEEPSVATIEAPECTEDQILQVIRMHDSWGDGWGDTNITISKIVPLMSSGDVSTTSRSHVVSISQTTYMEEGVGDRIFHGTLEDGYNNFVYICMEIGTCYNIEVGGVGDWQDEIKWDISDASTCTGSAESCYEEVEETYAKGIAPSECRFSVPDENGILKCPFSCKLYTNAPSYAPSDQPSPSPSASLSEAPSDAPSLVPVSVGTFYPTVVDGNATAIGKNAGIPSASIVPARLSNTSAFPSSAPSHSPSLVPIHLDATGRRPSSSESSNPPSQVTSHVIAPSGTPSTKPSAQPSTTPFPTITTGHGMISMDDPDLKNALYGEPSPAPAAVLEPSSRPTDSATSSKPTESATDGPSVAATEVDDRIIASYDYEEDQRVWSAWMGMPEMFEGVVVGVNTDVSDGSKTYNITYTDDGSMEAFVGPDLLFPIKLTETELNNRPSIVEEQRVQARYAGDIYWFGAKVTKDNGNGTYALLYSDGDSEGNVTGSLIRFDHYTDGTLVEVEETFIPSPSPSPTLQRNPATVKVELLSASPLVDIPTIAIIQAPQNLPPSKDASLLTVSTPPSSTPTRDFPTAKIVEPPNTIPTNSGNSFRDRLQALLQVSTGAPSTGSPSSPPESDIVFVVLSPSKSPTASPSLESTTEKIPTVVMSPEVIPTVVLSPTDFPTSQPASDIDSADFPSAEPIMVSPTESAPAAADAPSGFASSTARPTTTAEPTVVGSAEGSGLNSIDVPDSLYGKITGQYI